MNDAAEPVPRLRRRLIEPSLAPPELVLRVGAIGQRRLAAPNPDASPNPATSPGDTKPLDTVLGEVLRTLASILASVQETSDLYAEAPPRLRLLSGLADGADQHAADAALAAGADPEAAASFELHVILPFAPETFRDHTVDDRPRFDRLLAAAESVLVLDGIYEPNPRPDKPQAPENFVPRRRRQKAYRAVAWYTLQQSDILIAIWDPSQEGRPGGTEETLRQALHAGIPAIWINPLAGNAVHLLRGEDDIEWPQTRSPYWRGLLEQELHALLLPAESESGPEGAEEAGADGDEPAAEASDAAQSAAEPERALPARQWLAEFFGREGSGTSYRQRLWTRLTGAATPAPAAPPPKASEPVPFFEVYRKRAAQLGRYYAGLYRGAFLLNYLLGLVAILLAALGTAVAAMFGESAEPPLLSLALGGLELVTILAILRNTHEAQRGTWQEKAIDYRFLAELFRTMTYLAPLGCAPPPSHVWTHYAAHNPRQTWMHWLFRSVIREAPAVLPGLDRAREFRFDGPHVEACRARVTEDWIPSQRQHHRNNAEAMGRIYETIEHWGQAIFAGTALLVFLHIFLDLVVFGIAAVSGHEENFVVADGVAVIEQIGPWLAFLGTVLPAAVLAANGFRYQAECRRLRDRSASMARQLEKNLAAFRHLAEPERAQEGCVAWDAARKTHALAQQMVDEVADWRIVYRMHEVSAA